MLRSPPAFVASLLLFVMAFGFGGGQARAEASQGPVVVELYTSQGCSACPPADEMLAHLAEKDGIIALALHVDYWDYIGWKDLFANAEFSRRQKLYARQAGNRMVYTPQMIIGGAVHVVGNRPMEVMDAIDAVRSTPYPVDVRLVRGEGGVRIEAEAHRALPGRTVVLLLRYRPSATVEIARGENAGRTLDYANIVTAYDQVADWSGASPLLLDVAIAGEEPVVVLVQIEDHGPIVGAAQLR